MSDDGSSGWRPTWVVITCEHAGREVPQEFRHLFRGAAKELRSHRGYDPGAMGVALHLAGRLAAPLHFTSVTRLLIEANRSVGHAEHFSEYSRGLTPSEQQAILEKYYQPHRNSVVGTIEHATRSGHRVLHLSVHSFTDVWNGVAREMDIGLLFDPSRESERMMCKGWQEHLESADGGLRTRHNEPYLGIDDGLTTALRQRFGDAMYAGVEVEIRQGLIARTRGQRVMGELLTETLRRLLGSESVA